MVILVWIICALFNLLKLFQVGLKGCGLTVIAVLAAPLYTFISVIYVTIFMKWPYKVK